jgi:hypothetical protein
MRLSRRASYTTAAWTFIMTGSTAFFLFSYFGFLGS